MNPSTCRSGYRCGLVWYKGFHFPLSGEHRLSTFLGIPAESLSSLLSGHLAPFRHPVSPARGCAWIILFRSERTCSSPIFCSSRVLEPLGSTGSYAWAPVEGADLAHYRRSAPQDDEDIRQGGRRDVTLVSKCLLSRQPKKLRSLPRNVVRAMPSLQPLPCPHNARPCNMFDSINSSGRAAKGSH